MPCVPIDSGKSNDPFFYKLTTAVDVLQNIFYLLEKEQHDPKKVRELLAMSRLPLKLLKECYIEQHAAHRRRRDHRENQDPSACFSSSLIHHGDSELAE
jgi:hypothetical protein